MGNKLFNEVLVFPLKPLYYYGFRLSQPFSGVQVTRSFCSTLVGADTGRSYMGLLGNLLDTLTSIWLMTYFSDNSNSFPQKAHILTFNKCHLVSEQISFFSCYHNKQDEWGWEYGIQARARLSQATQRCDVIDVGMFFSVVITLSFIPSQIKTVVFSNSLPNKKKIKPNFLNTCFSFQGPVSERLVWHGQELQSDKTV